MLGVYPGPWTLRELLAACEHRQRAAWDHTAAVLAMLANCHRDPRRGSPYKPSDFNPYRATSRVRATGDALKRESAQAFGILKRMVTGGKLKPAASRRKG